MRASSALDRQSHPGSPPGPSIVYLGGCGRSGSTLLGRVLGESEGAVCVGETQYLWSRGLRDNVVCGCGRPFRDCEFWAAVGELAFGGWENLEQERCIRVDRLTNRLRALPAHRTEHVPEAFALARAEYTDRLRMLYRAIADVAGVSTIVETSKDPAFASLLSLAHGADLRIVHLVRDSRAVAYSWTRTGRIAPGATGEHMPVFSVRRTATSWLAANSALQLQSRRSPYLRIRYERFVEDPHAELERLSVFAHAPFALPAKVLDGRRVLLSAHHIFSGNPMRERTGWIEMVPDEEWRTRLGVRRHMQVTALTWPLLLGYGYGLGRARAATVE
jgi:hypothetical protein